MLLVAKRGREDEIFDVFEKWGLDAVAIGVVTGDGMLRVKHHGKVVAEIPNRALADEAPRYHRPYTQPLRPQTTPIMDFRSADLTADLKTLLEAGDICSKRWIWEQYDHQVRTNTITGPGADAAVLRIKGTNTSVAMSLDGNGRYCALDPREGTKLIVAECCRNLSTVGALPIATTNNLNFGNPERPEIMAQLVESIEGLAEACRFFDVPVTGGNVSLYNETLGAPIYPTPVVGIVGTLETAPPIGIPFANPGKFIILLGGLGRRRVRVKPVCQRDFARSVGKTSGAGHGLREARPADDPTAGPRAPGRICSRHKCGRIGGGVSPVLFWRRQPRARGRLGFGFAAGTALVSRRSVANSSFRQLAGRDYFTGNSERCSIRDDWRYT
jgi:selenophosphate synthetase-related protein